MLCLKSGCHALLPLQAEQKMRGKKRQGSRQGSADMSKRSPSVRCMPFSAVSTSSPWAAAKACTADLLKSAAWS